MDQRLSAADSAHSRSLKRLTSSLMRAEENCVSSRFFGLLFGVARGRATKSWVRGRSWSIHQCHQES
jgi:hypothetical protein